MQVTVHWRLALVGIAAVALGGAAFFVTREFTENEPAGAQQATPESSATVFDPTPDLTATPEPDATPDLDEPGWYVPYLNRDGQLPRFEGAVNGIVVGSGDGSAEDPYPEGCSESYSQEFGPEAVARYGSSPVAIPVSLPAGMEIFSGSIYGVCLGGTPVTSEAVVAVREFNGPRDGLGEGSISVRRFQARVPVGIQAPEERWYAGTIDGQPVAVLRPIIESIGDSAIVAYDAEANVTTMLYGQGVYLESLELLYAEIAK